MDYPALMPKSTFRHFQEVYRNSTNPLQDRYPYKPHVKRSVGEYFPTVQDRVDFLDYLSESNMMPYWDKVHLKEKRKLVDYYEYKGLAFGLLHGTVCFFLPGIRLLPIYKRMILPIIAFVYWKRWGYNLGRDFYFCKGRNIIENLERDLGVRNFQTGL